MITKSTIRNMKKQSIDKISDSHFATALRCSACASNHMEKTESRFSLGQRMQQNKTSEYFQDVLRSNQFD
jgi:hypothetical protein